MEKARISKSGVPYLYFGKGDPLVLIHGLGEVKEGWSNQYELADEFELVIPDLRGHGDCTKTDGISIPNFAQDIIGLLKELEIENAHILGLSMGGAVAQEIYHQAPNLCRSLTLVSTFHYFPKILKQLLFNNRREKFEYVRAAGKQTEYLAHIALYSWNKNMIDTFSHSFRPKHLIFLKSLKTCLEVNNRSLLPLIKIPTLIIGGQYDSVLPVWIQACMHRLIPHSEFVIMRNTGHLAKLEAKDRFNQQLRRFLNQHRTAV
ncbi:alpha/beta fold hydrolase [Neobacillus cucumis]|uniref:Alpha/beta hydrolase n=1 Tax=Neobacillus cucumis TaxID=1740721 RepID=A0A2N5HBC2_9BACI|nr:alpha/beta hydrolase [Neobacillus cucumis]PLS02826.1 alpha/beta hydrolase [Neobacillus cucumis]